MLLKEKKFQLRDEEGNKPDLSEEKDIAILNDGKDNGLRLEHVFRSYALNEGNGVIYGTSLLSFFTPKDGMLVDQEGHTVQFLSSERKPLLIVDNTEEPFIDDDRDIDFEYVKAFVELFKIQTPDVLFGSLLNDEEKQYFISLRQAKQKEQEAEVTKENQLKMVMEADKANTLIEQISNEQDASKLKQEAGNVYFDSIMALDNNLLADDKKKETILNLMTTQLASLSKINEATKREQELKDSIDPDYIVDMRKYKQHQKFYSELESFKEYVSGNTHLFYGRKWEEFAEDPFILIKRGSDWFEDAEIDTDNMIEDEKQMEVEFVDGEERKKVILNFEKDEITILPV